MDVCQTHHRRAECKQHGRGFQKVKGVQANLALSGQSSRKRSRQAPVNPQTPTTEKATDDRPAEDRRENLCPLCRSETPSPCSAGHGASEPLRGPQPVPPHSPHTWGTGRRGAEAGAGPRTAAPLPFPRLAPPRGPPFPSSAAELGLKDRN